DHVSEVFVEQCEVSDAATICRFPRDDLHLLRARRDHGFGDRDHSGRASALACLAVTACLAIGSGGPSLSATRRGFGGGVWPGSRRSGLSCFLGRCAKTGGGMSALSVGR